jgi:peptidoglycan/xylan/chitin deacetylase (PgdA/CDA1 family)
MKNKKKYFNNKNNFFHGIMFHNFHDVKRHKAGQGSISKKDFLKLINFIGRKNIINADEFLLRFNEKTLKKNHVCLTFDDGSISQFDVAMPVLKKLKIKAIFFLYSSMFTNKPDFLEVYRYFRINFFRDVDEFYSEFYEHVDSDHIEFLKKNKKIIIQKKKTYPHYTINDIKFRLVRDKFITRIKYENIMIKLFKEKKFSPKKYFNNLFMKKEHLIKIYKSGHLIGLHSHTHPTVIKKLSYKSQLKEYKRNSAIFSKILNCSKDTFKTMSHPCGSFNMDTKKVLNKLNIDIGFIAKMYLKNKSIIPKYEIPRQDHSDIMDMMKDKL